MYEINDELQKQRDALVGIHINFCHNLTGREYNALLKAIWRLDREMAALRETEQNNA